MRSKTPHYRRKGPGRKAIVGAYHDGKVNRSGTKLTRRFYGEAAAERLNQGDSK